MSKNSANFCFRVSYDTGIPTALRELQRNGVSINFYIVETLKKRLSEEGKLTNTPKCSEAPPSPQSVTIQIILPSSKEER